MLTHDCIFCKIAKKEIPSKLILDTEDYIVFNDINPQAPIHAVIAPKIHFKSLNEITDYELLGKIFEGVRKTAAILNIQENYRTVVNTGEEAGQTVFHMHIHLLSGRPMLWPPG